MCLLFFGYLTLYKVLTLLSFFQRVFTQNILHYQILGCDALGNYYKYKYLDKYLDMPKELTKEEMEALYKND